MTTHKGSAIDQVVLPTEFLHSVNQNHLGLRAEIKQSFPVHQIKPGKNKLGIINKQKNRQLNSILSGAKH